MSESSTSPQSTNAASMAQSWRCSDGLYVTLGGACPAALAVARVVRATSGESLSFAALLLSGSGGKTPRSLRSAS